MRLMVIGARGFLGTHVRTRALAAGIAIVTAGRSELTGPGRHERVDIAGDDPARIAATISAVSPDAVVNCAGVTAADPAAQVAAHVTGTYTLVKAMLLVQRPCRLVHLGSAAEYGRGEPGVPVTERATPQPHALYGVTKLAATRLVELAAAAGLDAVVLRVFNPVGPAAPPGSLPGRLAAELRRALDVGTDVRVGSLDAVRDFVDVRDVADAVIAAARARALPHRVLNIGSGRAVPVRLVATQLVTISGHAGRLREDDPTPPRSADIPWQQADIGRASQDLGWTPRHDLTTSLTDLWEASR